MMAGRDDQDRLVCRECGRAIMGVTGLDEILKPARAHG